VLPPCGMDAITGGHPPLGRKIDGPANGLVIAIVPPGYVCFAVILAPRP
jgi:hypothetical protein